MERVKLIKARYKDDIPLNNADYQFMMDYFKQHDDYIEKVGVGVKEIVLREFRGSQGFWFIRTDDTEVTISAIKLHPTHARRVKDASRYEIQEQITEFKRTTPIGICELCNVKITEAFTHADHVLEFIVIWNNFIKLEQIDESQIKVQDTSNGINKEFCDRELAKRWYDYHKANATLRHVHQRCNLTRPKARTSTPAKPIIKKTGYKPTGKCHDCNKPVTGTYWRCYDCNNKFKSK
jgi:hypothetical protein